jgi:hypothetical protein
VVRKRHTSNGSSSLDLWGKADAVLGIGYQFIKAQTQRVPRLLEMSMEEVLFNIIFLFFAVSGFLAWAFIIFICILYFFINRDLNPFDMDKERWG